MTRKNILLFVLLIGILGISGCKKYLDVQPEDKFIDEQVFSSETSVQQALNAIYINLFSDSLYGGCLTSTTVEILARKYKVGGEHSLANEQNNYGEIAAAGTTFDVIWRKAYSTILGANLFISQLRTAAEKGVLTKEKAALLEGEATAIRAMIHFDMLRLYGPIYSPDSSAVSIPYHDQPKVSVNPLLSAIEVVNRVLLDLETAETLLAADPVISQGVINAVTQIDFYSTARNRRMNYYAALALKARVMLYRNNKPAAYSAAKKTLLAIGQHFPWMRFSDIVGASSPDRVFSPEVILGLHYPRMYTMFDRYFAGGLSPNNILAPLPQRLAQAFENNINDYRYKTTWQQVFGGSEAFYKYSDVADGGKSFRYLLPLLRKSELYYIVAETATDENEAFEYLNTVRFNRGLPDLEPGNADLKSEIRKEYVREFSGEGQLFYYYKRNNITELPNPLQPDSWWNVYISFAIPLPQSETILR